MKIISLIFTGFSYVSLIRNSVTCRALSREAGRCVTFNEDSINCNELLRDFLKNESFMFGPGKNIEHDEMV
jgi:hypothetical protein